MSKEVLDEREFELINIIGAQLGSNQRDLSRMMDLSLGQTNMLIRRLVSKGLIRISQLNKRKVQYLLTPKGFAEKINKSIKYTLKTIHSISAIKTKIGNVVIPLYEKGERDFIVLGKSDFASLIEMVLNESGHIDCNVKYVDQYPSDELQGTVLVCREDIDITHKNGRKIIDLVRELALDHSILLSAGIA